MPVRARPRPAAERRARLEALALPGSIYLSRGARDQVRDRMNVTLEDMGEVVASWLGLEHDEPSGRLYRGDGNGGFVDVSKRMRWRATMVSDCGTLISA